MIKLQSNYAITSSSGSFTLVTFVKGKDKECEISAIQMFEELGYEIYIDSAHISYLFRNNEYFKYKKIDFNLVGEELSVEGASLSKADMQAIFMQCLELGLVEQVPKYKTNLDHYRDKIIEDCMWNLALVKGEPKKCSDTSCRNCDFYDKDDAERGCYDVVKKWLKQPYKKPANKLTQFEYDLIKTFDHCKECCLLNEIESLKKLSEKGYFKGIDPFTKVHDIIDNCEVVK